MTKKEISESLTLYGIKKSKVEADLGMPLNSLSGILKNDKELPKKWAEALRKYVDDLNNPQKDLETPKEAQQETEIEKAVESTQNEIKPTIAPVIDNYEEVRVVLNSRPILEPNQTFDQLLKQFNSLADLSEKPKDIKLKLEQIKESAKNSNLTPRQTDSITDRVNFYLNGQYGKAKHSLILS